MRVFVTGANGVLGGAVVPRLVGEGHEVRALARPETNTDRLTAATVEPVRADLFDVRSLEQAVRGSDAILHLATRIPPTSRVRFRRSWAENDRLRGLGTKNVVDAAQAAGVGTVVYPSFAAVYADAGSEWIDATTGALDPLWFLDSTLEAEEHVSRFASGGGHGVSLRLGFFYGPESPQTREMLTYARQGFAVMPGAGDAYTPTLWVQDAAAAVVAALGAPSGLYDVADDDPLTRDDYAAALAAAVGRKRLRRPPMFAARLSTGSVAKALARSLRISNRRFKEASGWSPSVPSAREGWTRMAGA